MAIVDKRGIGAVFRSRLRIVLKRFDGNQAEFADSINLDRSALSQLLSDSIDRLPRAETLYAITRVHGISLDWLLGLHDDSDKQFIPALEIEDVRTASTADLLLKWREKSSGHKIRYVPSTIPIPYRTKAVEDYEMAKYSRTDQRRQPGKSGFGWFEDNGQDDTEMDICMPVQQLELLAEGRGFWHKLDLDARREQIDHLADMLDRHYPAVRLYLYNEIDCYSITYVQYGPDHASIFTGGSYLVVNDRDHIRKLRDDFDNLIKQAVISPEKSVEFIRGLAVS